MYTVKNQILFAENRTFVLKIILKRICTRFKSMCVQDYRFKGSTRLSMQTAWQNCQEFVLNAFIFNTANDRQRICIKEEGEGSLSKFRHDYVARNLISKGLVALLGMFLMCLTKYYLYLQIFIKSCGYKLCTLTR